MKKIAVILLVIFVHISVASSAQTNGALVQSKSYNKMLKVLLNHTVPAIGCRELYSCYNDYIILDTREKNEYDVCHLPNAIHVGYDDFDIKSLTHLDKNSKIICYCSVGYRSEKIGDKMLKAGFTHVVNLYGSIFEWANCNYPLVNNQNDTVLQVHAYSKLWGQWMNNSKIQKIYN